ncbi:MAG TPA: hypothetical protein EYQ50_24580 [Verrucomicrobiales bacterium]|nr:hypothetical protein [Verrucomicrobiales bacterium]HIL71124.1 hypothetical protein [Verrucomicrobiota bacterium]
MNAEHPMAASGITSLTNPNVHYKTTDRSHILLQQGNITAVIVNNQAVDSSTLSGHRAGYNGLAFLSHKNRKQNLFVPPYAGLNFEHIHDGTVAGLKEKFEPRKFPMNLRVINRHTVEIHQPPTGNWSLESCGRYKLLKDGTIEYTFECIPRKGEYQYDYIGLFWASYIHKPGHKEIHFKGRRRHESNDHLRWITAETPKHGVSSTHPPADSTLLPPVEKSFPLTLVNHPSDYVYEEPWYFGVSNDMALIFMFRKKDRIWFAQSPSGGGPSHPAWDFQWFIPNYKIGEAYGFTMRLAYLPFQSPTQITSATSGHRGALNRQP